jgi:hypothetical protein
MNVYTISFVALFTVFIATIFYLILKENGEVKNLRKNFTTMSIEDIKNLILKLSKDGIFINEDIFNKINLHFNLQNDELRYSLRQMNPDPDINNPYSIITVGDFLIKAGSDFKSALDIIFIGSGFLLILTIPAIMAYKENDKQSFFISTIIISLIAIVLFIYVIIFQYKGFNALIKAGKKFNSEKLSLH